jgi:hypothetical protein
VVGHRDRRPSNRPPRRHALSRGASLADDLSRPSLGTKFGSDEPMCADLRLCRRQHQRGGYFVSGIVPVASPTPPGAVSTTATVAATLALVTRPVGIRHPSRGFPQDLLALAAPAAGVCPPEPDLPEAYSGGSGIRTLICVPDSYTSSISAPHPPERLLVRPPPVRPRLRPTAGVHRRISTVNYLGARCVRPLALILPR